MPGGLSQERCSSIDGAGYLESERLFGLWGKASMAMNCVVVFETEMLFHIGQSTNYEWFGGALVKQYLDIIACLSCS